MSCHGPGCRRSVPPSSFDEDFCSARCWREWQNNHAWGDDDLPEPKAMPGAERRTATTGVVHQAGDLSWLDVRVEAQQ